MRATGFGIRSPKDNYGELLYPMTTSNGVKLDMYKKSLSEKRRELLFIQKHKLNDLEKPDENPTGEINCIPNIMDKKKKEVKINVKDLVGAKFSTFGKQKRFNYNTVSQHLEELSHHFRGKYSRIAWSALAAITQTRFSILKHRSTPVTTL